jgi:prepilin-type N-terminal cleavage/methylation domain-containing protein
MIMKQKKQAEGFTLVELMVSIALFSVLVSIAAGGFVQALRSERQITAMVSTESNISIALEEMTREMRTGYLFCHQADSEASDAVCDCQSDGAPDPTWTCPAIEFHNSSGTQVEYFRGDSSNANAPTSTILYRYDGDTNTTNPITGDDIDITNLKFILFGQIEGDNWNPRITISMGAEPDDSTISWAAINLQTTVSARTIDCVPNPNPSSTPQC